jgi:CRISPR/Cas system-associated protein Csm6
VTFCEHLISSQVIDDFLIKRGRVPAYLDKVESSRRQVKTSHVLPKFFDGVSKEYDAYEKDIAVLNVFFETTTVMQVEYTPVCWTGILFFLLNKNGKVIFFYYHIKLKIIFGQL